MKTAHLPKTNVFRKPDPEKTGAAPVLVVHIDLKPIANSPTAEQGDVTVTPP